MIPQFNSAGLQAGNGKASNKDMHRNLDLFHQQTENRRRPCKDILYAAIVSTFIFASSCLAQSPVDALAIVVTGESREFVYTNKESAFLYGETNSGNTTSWQGFNVFGFEFLDDYVLIVDGKHLDRKDARTTVYPDHLVREYPDGITEQVRPADSVALFSIIVTSKKSIDLQVIPCFTDGKKTSDYMITADGGTVLIARANHLGRTAQRNFPVWLAIHGDGWKSADGESRKGNQYSPVVLEGRKGQTHMIAFAVADDEREAMAIARKGVGDPVSFFRERRARMEKLLRETEVRTDDARFNKALAWAKISLDALMMNQITKGIFAGLPWFNNYWGRDTFISLPGAALVTGRFSEAKEILRSFAAFQQTDTSSTDYGRIPNIVTTTDKAYNTADGTPRLVMMAHDYIRRSGDTAFASEVYPVVKRSIEGTIGYHMDSLGFLVHGDAETWMDAVGPDGPWSPRGNRANDIQGLWAQQLTAGMELAMMNRDTASADDWLSLWTILTESFGHHFVQDGRIVDHLNADGTPDGQIRPNQIFTAHLLDDGLRTRVLKEVTSKLTYEYGVASLWQEDGNFHPYHVNEPFYPKDAAYHNGTVWTWVQGPLISEMCRFGKQDLAWNVTRNSVDQILDRGAVGTQSELLDAITRPGKREPRLSGTFSQAWNLAEFIRNFYDDYLGAAIYRYNHMLVLRPRLPDALGDVKATLNLDGRSVPVELTRDATTQRISIDGTNLRIGGTVLLSLLSVEGLEIKSPIPLPPRSRAQLELQGDDLTCWINGSKTDIPVEVHPASLPHSSLELLRLATPTLVANLKSLRGPDYPMIPHAVIKSINAAARTLVDATDPEGDDTGVGASGETLGRYVYPQNPNFVPGCLDLTGFKAATDDSLAYFTLLLRALSDPGWHPEYGFQLTYVAIAIDQDGIAGSGQEVVPQNAGFVLDATQGYERLILVGGGVRVEDAGGKILAGYIPTAPDVSNPLGDTRTATISFAIPHAYLGKPDSRWTYTVLVGGQDDHGGAGLGEFRTVNQNVGEWSGGGRIRADDSNAHDILQTRGR